MYLPVLLYHYVSRILVKYGRQRHYRSKRGVFCSAEYVTQIGKDLLEFAEKLEGGRTGWIIYSHIETSNKDWPGHPAISRDPMDPRGTYQTILPYKANISLLISIIASTASLTRLSSLETLKTSLNSLNLNACQ